MTTIDDLVVRQVVALVHEAMRLDVNPQTGFAERYRLDASHLWRAIAKECERRAAEGTFTSPPVDPLAQAREVTRLQKASAIA
jgi:hypothetical protein